MTVEMAIALNRFGLGARQGELSQGPQAPIEALRAQISGRTVDFPSQDLRPAKESLVAFGAYIQFKRGKTPKFDESKQKEFQGLVRKTTASEIGARTAFAAATPASFHERLVRFWSNHFSVSARGAQASLIAGAYEREAIRPHILGRFSDLAAQAIFHQGMLIYLDNWQSIGPKSKAGRRSGRGLNENLAREVLELHTVTPDADYTQNDVTELARALTGWTVGNKRVGKNRQGEALFSSLIHEPGARTVLGQRYSDAGGQQAQQILMDLCQHPKTAQHIAFKLARHFHSDEPPASLVARLETAFLDNDGALTPVYRALIDAPEMWEPSALKLKTPDELLVSAARLIGTDAVFAGNPRKVFESLAQRPFNAPSPEGWPDTEDDWLTPDGLQKRIEWAGRVARRSATIDARRIMEQGLGPLASERSMTAIARAESGEQALTLALMSPEFQRR